MSNFRLVPLPSALTDQARDTLRSPQYGHPAHRETASGTGPCRSCLAPFDVGVDERLLFTYDPFADLDDLPLPGPIFIHAQRCVPHDGAGFPESLGAMPLVAETYRAGRPAAAHTPLTRGSEASDIAALLDDACVQWLHLRHAIAGCFVARVDRISSNPS
ncbi:MAG: DUF1203 domain-containing protein [Gemmatimonadaceae bacterium]